MGLGHMMRTTPLLFGMTIVGAVITLVSAAYLFSGGSWVWAIGVIGGLSLEVGSMALHDQWHLRHDETPHAVWGMNDARRPQSLGGPRVRGEK